MPNVEKIPIEEEVPLHSIPNGEPEQSNKKGGFPSDREDYCFDKLQLQELTSTPVWVGIRWTLLVVFWLSFIAMLAVVITLIVVTPRCPTLSWYESSVIYQVYPQTFQDSDDNGIGDFVGISQRLSHIAEAGAKILSLGSIFESDSEGDVTDFNQIDASLGTIEQLQQLLGMLPALEMKLCIDFIPNHTSQKHLWFEESRHNKTNSYHDYYVWAEGGANSPASTPPNNWLSVTGESAWSYEPLRQQWYLHSLGTEKPDLNYRSDNLRTEITSSLEYWLKEGIDGVFFKDVSYLFESEDLEDEPVDPYWFGSINDYDYLLHTKTFNQPETYKLLGEWQSLFSDYSFLGKHRLFSIDVAESTNASVVPVNADLAMTNFLADGLQGPLTGRLIDELVRDWLDGKDSSRRDAISLGSADHSRVASRLGGEYVLTLNTLVQTLPGTPLLYYGEEIGMTDLGTDTTSLRSEEDAWRSPMQWANVANAGFSGGNSSQMYISLNSNYRDINVEDQSKDDYSVFKRYSQLAQLCQMPSLLAGELTPAIVNDNLYSFTMQYPDWPGYLVAISVGTSNFYGDFHSEVGLPANGLLVYSTLKGTELGKIGMDKFLVNSMEAVIVEYT